MKRTSKLASPRLRRLETLETRRCLAASIEVLSTNPADTFTVAEGAVAGTTTLSPGEQTNGHRGRDGRDRFGHGHHRHHGRC